MTKDYNVLEHVLTHFFEIQNLLVKQSCLVKPTTTLRNNRPTNSQRPHINIKPNLPSPRPSVVPPAPPPPPRPRPTPPTPPPPPTLSSPVNVFTRRSKKATPKKAAGPSLNFANLKRMARNKRERKVKNLLTQPDVEPLLTNIQNANKRNLERRLINERNGSNVNEVRAVLAYQNTLKQLKTNNRMKNETESYLMNNIGRYLPKRTNRNNKSSITSADINSALDSLNVETTLISLGGTDVKRGDIPPLVNYFKQQPKRNLTRKDLFNALNDLGL